MININQIDLYHLDQELLAKIKGWINAYQQHQTIYSNFLSLSQVALVEKVFINNNVKYFIHDALNNSLRKTISLYNHHSNIVLLSAVLMPNSMIKHNNLLGYLLNELQIKFEVIGDLFFLNNILYLAVIKKISPLLLNNPIIIKKEILSFNLCHEQININYEFDYQTLFIASLRLDVMISEICYCSRTNSEKLLAKGSVFVNFTLLNKKNYLIKIHDILSIRKFGRFQVISIILLPSNKYKIVMGKFK